MYLWMHIYFIAIRLVLLVLLVLSVLLLNLCMINSLLQRDDRLIISQITESSFANRDDIDNEQLLGEGDDDDL